ncbi:MAG TPA: AprI/Inh family metalloprotease inhibitor [Xanthobacteraceae bacterium]|nr:AprI/Inh family metalloprotease inhibitor [Xanthobacteraceae bacterium]
MTAHVGRKQPNSAKIATLLAIALAILAGCATQHPNTSPDEDAAASSPPPSPAKPSPPPTDLGGKWKFTTGSGSCLMAFSANPGAADGTIAPAGGCPGAFFTSRKWSYEHDRLILRDHKGNVLVELSFADGHFQGQGPTGAVTLAR